MTVAPGSTVDDVATCIRSMKLMATGNLGDIADVYQQDATNREATEEPPEARGGGPQGIYATALWLRQAFSGLSWDVHDAVQDGDTVVLHTTMRGRQTGPFVTYTAQAEIDTVLPPRGRTFAVTQSHWFRMSDGKIAEHWANRDDMALGKQLGWTPPTPVYLAKMLLATRQMRRAST